MADQGVRVDYGFRRGPRQTRVRRGQSSAAKWQERAPISEQLPHGKQHHFLAHECSELRRDRVCGSLPRNRSPLPLRWGRRQVRVPGSARSGQRANPDGLRGNGIPHARPGGPPPPHQDRRRSRHCASCRPRPRKALDLRFRGPRAVLGRVHVSGARHVEALDHRPSRLLHIPRWEEQGWRRAPRRGHVR